MHRNITQFLEQSIDPQKGVDSEKYRGLVAWYYLNEFEKQPILSFASDDELVFRVPISWLQANAVACLEHAARMTEEDPASRYLPIAFLTAIVVPLEYRITDSTPHKNEEKLAMTTLQVQELIYDTHVRIDPQLRSKQYYKDFYNAKRAAEEERLNESSDVQLPVNPF